VILQRGVLGVLGGVRKGRPGGKVPKINSLGKRGESATSSPPKPQPMSATVICFVNCFGAAGLLAEGEVGVV